MRAKILLLQCAALALGTIALLTNFFSFVNTYAVNLLFNDQWDLFDVFRSHPSAWQLFRYPRGPHRQGIAFVLTRFVAEQTAWNTRGEAFLVAGMIAAAMAIALILKWRLTGFLGPLDLLVPLIFLTTAQYDTLVLVPNAAHSAAPLLLIMLCALEALARHRARGPLLLLLEFLTIHTGFGLFAGFVLVALLSLEVWKAFRQPDPDRRQSTLLLLIGALTVLGTFFVDYHPLSAAVCFTFPDPQWPFYLSFVSLMFGAFGGFLLGNMPVTGALASAVFLAAVLWVVGRACLRLLRVRSIDDDPRTLVVAGLGLFSLLFAAMTAIGRICFSPAYGQSSRYMTLLIPAVLAIYLELAAMTRAHARLLTVLLLGAMVAHGYLPLSVPITHPVAAVALGKKRWRDCYTGSLDRARCDAESRLHVYDALYDQNLDERLRYIRAHHLNIFAPSRLRHD